ncbi:MAG: methyltransferase [Gemmatimonadaceae bacterium]
MPETKHSRPNNYHEWKSVAETILGQRYFVATKPGVFSHGRLDPAATLLAEHALVKEGEVVVHLNCGNGLFGAVASTNAARVFFTDRHFVSFQAAKRTLALNNITNAEVRLGQGTFVLPADTRANVVGIRIPHEKQALFQLMHDAFKILLPGGRCYIAGANNEGIKTAQKTIADIFGNANKLAEHASHRVIVATKRREEPATPDIFESAFLEGDSFSELPVQLRGMPVTLYSRPGVFSWDHVDEATALLAEHMVVNKGESVLDLGCGSGGLGTIAARLSGTGRVRMVDADNEAVRSTRGTIEVAGVKNASVVVSDVASAVIDERFDVVVSNPPFHVGKATNLELPLQFIRDAFEVLNPKGRLYLVANRTLPYESMIAEQFGGVQTVHDGVRFKVLSAIKP